MFNKIILMGRLTADPELKQTTNGNSVTSFTIAVDRPYSKGEKKTDFITVVAWRQAAEFIGRYFSKGNMILIDGSLQSRTYTTKDGQNRTVWEVVAEQVRFTGSRAENQPGALQDKSIDIDRTPDGSEDFTELDDYGLPF